MNLQEAELSLQEVQKELAIQRSLYKEVHKEAILYYKRNRIDEKDHSVKLPEDLRDRKDNIHRIVVELHQQETIKLHELSRGICCKGGWCTVSKPPEP